GGHFWIDVDWINKAPFGLIRKAHKLLGSGLSREELIIRAHKEYLDESSFEKWAVDTAYGRLYSKIDEAITHPRRRTNVNLSYDMNGASNFLKMALGEKVASKIQDELISRVNSFFEDLNDPEKNYGGDLENLQFQIKEIGINEVELGDRLELLNNLRKFCMATTAAYVRTARFVMEMYKGRNPNFTDEKMQKIVTRHLDTPSFTIYGKEAGERFIGDNLESDEGEFNSEGILLNFNLPRIFGRFWYLGGEGKLAQPAPKDKVEWGYFYRICMPVVWGKINEASSYGLSLTRINDFSVHDWEKFYYLYDVGPAKHRGYYMNRKRYRFVDNK
ncbi:MAG: hypothetical protein Q4A79_01030, partial [Candidatus Saccharibacteria bacterium]|nr:hypothetical protein [Candidatus Saccharibacteria bacterium]